MKFLLLLAAIGLSRSALAVSECGGRALDGSFVLVQINTTGTTGAPDQASVTVEKDGNKFGYHFGREDIPQFFEYDDVAAKSSVVGLAAYVQKEFPVSIKYVGANFVDMDLKAVIDGGKAEITKGNIMRIWKGPGHPGTDQYQLTKIVCSVWANI